MNKLLKAFLLNFTVTRKIELVNKERIVGHAYYKDNIQKDNKGRETFDAVPLKVYKWNYRVENTYMIFGNKFTTTRIVSKESSDENEIPFGVKGTYQTKYSNLCGYENACYNLENNKNIFSVYGKLSDLTIPNDLRELFKQDKELSSFVYMYYRFLKGENVTPETIESIQRIFQIEEEIKRLQEEKQKILNDVSMKRKQF